MKILIIDNYDSFTFNLYQLSGEVLFEHFPSEFNEIIVKRNDEISLLDVKKINPDKIIISPGPGSPDNFNYFGICSEVIEKLGKEQTPILGICLGMQGIVHTFGGKIVKARTPMHGKSSFLIHNENGIHSEIPQSVEIMRYHSLISSNVDIPNCLKITAFCTNESENLKFNDFDEKNNEIMSIEHLNLPIFGIQYHPESFATEGGKKIISNFFEI